MHDFLFGAFKVICIVGYVFISTVLLYNQRFQRWVKFSVSFFAVYAVSSFLFFGVFPFSFLGEDVLRALPYFLFFFGSAAVAGFCLVRGFTLRQSAGYLAGYLFLISVFLLLFSGVTRTPFYIPGFGTVSHFLTGVPYVLFFLSPLALGFGLYKELGFQQILGGLLFYFFCLALLLIGANAVFGIPFGAYFSLSDKSRQWIEMGSMLLLVGGCIGVYGFSNAKGMESKERFGMMLIFFMVMIFVCGTVQMTIGYEYMAKSIRSGSLWFPALNM